MANEAKKASVPATLEETEQILRLYRAIWRARTRSSRRAGTIFLALSAAFLVLSYFTRYLVFEVISIVSLPLGVALIFVSLEEHVKLSVCNESLASMLSPLSDLLKGLKIVGKAVYIPTGSKVLVFIPKDEWRGEKENHNEITRSELDKNGVVVSSPGAFLSRLYERELAHRIRDFDLSALVEWIPRILVESLKIARETEIKRTDDEIQVRLIEPIFISLCEKKHFSSVCRTLGCPICCSIGHILAESSKRIVLYEGCEHLPDENQLTSHFRLGSHIEAFETKDV